MTIDLLLRAGSFVLIAALAVSNAPAEEAGAALFEPCRACHSLDPRAERMAGPNLVGLIGRRVAGDPAFDYSPALRAAGGTGAVWTTERLMQYLSDTEAMFPGTWMSGQRIPDEAARKALTDFIANPNSR